MFSDGECHLSCFGIPHFYGTVITPSDYAIVLRRKCDGSNNILMSSEGIEVKVTKPIPIPPFEIFWSIGSLSQQLLNTGYIIILIGILHQIDISNIVKAGSGRKRCLQFVCCLL